jgi:YtkA-like
MRARVHFYDRTYVSPPSRRLSRGRLALARVGETPTRTAGQRPALHAAGHALLACALIFAGGCKKKEPPPGGAKSAIIATQAAPGSPFVMSLVLDPAQPKFASRTAFHVAIKQNGAPVNDAQGEISLVMPLMDMGKNQFALKPAGNGQYDGTGEFSMAGEWEVIVTASTQGRTGKTTFNVSVVE